ncbi:hypothetical protein DF186_14735, partial [Enterococcus hirae]
AARGFLRPPVRLPVEQHAGKNTGTGQSRRTDPLGRPVTYQTLDGRNCTAFTILCYNTLQSGAAFSSTPQPIIQNTPNKELPDGKPFRRKRTGVRTGRA